jgi:hypothetical protein
MSPRASEPRSQPARQERVSSSSDSFGLGIFEEPKREAQRPAAPQPAPPKPRAPEPKPEPPTRDDGGFGAGVR